jgi:hypothetical protein
LDKVAGSVTVEEEDKEEEDKEDEDEGGLGKSMAEELDLVHTHHPNELPFLPAPCPYLSALTLTLLPLPTRPCFLLPPHHSPFVCPQDEFEDPDSDRKEMDMLQNLTGTHTIITPPLASRLLPLISRLSPALSPLLLLSSPPLLSEHHIRLLGLESKDGQYKQEDGKPVHAPFYPYPKHEKWIVILYEKTKQRTLR